MHYSIISIKKMTVLFILVNMFSPLRYIHSAAEQLARNKVFDEEFYSRADVEQALKEGLDINSYSMGGDDFLPVGFTPLTYTINNKYQSNREEVITALIENNADVNKSTQTGGLSPLHYTRDARTVSQLLAHRANINQKDKKGRTPLEFIAYVCSKERSDAKINEYIETQKALIHAGADTSFVGNQLQEYSSETKRSSYLTGLKFIQRTKTEWLKMKTERLIQLRKIRQTRKVWLIHEGLIPDVRPSSFKSKNRILNEKSGLSRF